MLPALTELLSPTGVDLNPGDLLVSARTDSGLPPGAQHDVVSEAGPVRDERSGPERGRHGPAAPVCWIPGYGHHGHVTEEQTAYLSP